MEAGGRPEAGTLAGYAAHVAKIARGEAEKPIIVGHSLGGATITEAGELAPEAIAGLIYLTAVLLPNGATIADMGSLGLTRTVEPSMRLITEGAPPGCATVHPDDVVPFMYHRTDAEGQARALTRVGPQPLEPMGVPMSATSERWGSLPRAYIECLDDVIIPIEAQRAAQAALPCDPVVSIDCDHSPFFSATLELADALEEVTRAWA
jgi:pimeloyl-ACP methyl ester carboxylesterase